MRFSKICSLSSQKYLLDSFIRIRLRGVKRLFISPQYIEHKISIFNEIINLMKEYKHILYNFRKVPSLFKTGLITMFSPIFSLLEAYCYLINVKYVKNEVFENYFEQF